MDERWTKERKESLRSAASEAKDKMRFTWSKLGEKAGISAQSVRQFVSAGTLDDDKCDLLAKAMLDMGIVSSLGDGDPDVISDVRERMDLVETILNSRTSLRLRLAQAQSILEEGAQRIEQWRAATEGQADRES